MTVQERSEIQRKIASMIHEIHDIAIQLPASDVQGHLELAQYHLNRTAMTVNRIRVQDSVQVQFNQFTSGFPTS